MSVKVQNAPDSAGVGWHTTPDGGHGYWIGTAWTVNLAATDRGASEYVTTVDKVRAAVRAHSGSGATDRTAARHRAVSANRDGSLVSQILRRGGRPSV